MNSLFKFSQISKLQKPRKCNRQSLLPWGEHFLGNIMATLSQISPLSPANRIAMLIRTIENYHFIKSIKSWWNLSSKFYLSTDWQGRKSLHVCFSLFSTTMPYPHDNFSLVSFPWRFDNNQKREKNDNKSILFFPLLLNNKRITRNNDASWQHCVG